MPVRNFFSIWPNSWYEDTPMKHLLLMTVVISTALAVVTPLSLSGGAVETNRASESGEFRGVLLNEQCATLQPEWLRFADEHGLNCAMLPICFLSGYYLIIDENNVMKLDRRGELLARGLSQKTEKQDDFRVVIRGDLDNSILSVHSIQQQG